MTTVEPSGWHARHHDDAFEALSSSATDGLTESVAAERLLEHGPNRIEGKGETILFCLSGHGHFDMTSYTNYLAGNLVDQDYDEKELAMALSCLPKVAA